MILDPIINKYKRIKSNSILSEVQIDYKKNYAVVGIGTHSLATYYPLLSFLGVPVKYIVTKRPRTTPVLKNMFPAAETTTSLNEVLEDTTVGGMVICTPPDSLFAIAERCLAAKKHVLVEKPLCRSLESYQQMKSLATTTCLLALQRRYNTINKIITSKYKLFSDCSYEATFKTGTYPEGDALTELFIHCLDNLVFLMGPAQVHSVQSQKLRGGKVVQALLHHASGNKGMIELSTAQHWRLLEDKLSVHTHDAQIDLDYAAHYAGVRTLRGWKNKLSLDRLLPEAPPLKTIYQMQQMSVGFYNNSLVETGFYGLVKEFIHRTEGTAGTGYAPSDIHLLEPTFQLIAALNR